MTPIETTPQVVSGASANARFDTFDGLRAIAAVLVLLHHASYASARMYTGHFAAQFTQLDIGVAIFFLISGFLLYRPFAYRTVFDEPAASVRPFLVRRAVRIFPAYWLALTVIIVVGKLTGDRLLGLAIYPTSWLGYLPYYGLVHIYRNLDEARGGINQAWTLAVEITFYAFIPLYAGVVRRISRGRSTSSRYRIQLWGLAALVIVAVAFRAFVYWGHVGVLNAVGEYWLPANLDLFAAGMLLAVVSAVVANGAGPRRLVELVSKLAVLWWTLAVVVFWFGARVLPVGIDLRPTGWHGFYKHFLHGLVAFLFLLPAVFKTVRPSPVTRLLRQRPVVFIGTVSYGIYLWHQSWIEQAVRWQYQPIFKIDMLLLVVFGLAASTATAAISFFAVEQPLIRRVGRRR